MTFNQNSGRLLAPEPADPHWLLLATHQIYMAQVRRDEPAWFAQYEDCNDPCDASAAFELAATAPSEYMAGVLMGRGLALASLEALTERPDFPFAKPAASAASQ